MASTPIEPEYLHVDEFDEFTKKQNINVEELTAKVAELEYIINYFFKSNRFLFQRGLEILDGKNIKLGKTNGTQFGTATSEKIGFFGTTPATQYPSGGAHSAFSINGSTTSNEANGLTYAFDALRRYGLLP